MAMEEIDDGETLWRIDRTFLASNWTCIWGRGCHGIRPEPAASLALGCCSSGAELDGEDEARTIAASAAALRPELFEHHRSASAGGVLAVVAGDAASSAHDPGGVRTGTRVVDGACIFLNRPGFAGGAGCALHLAAVAVGESPIDWKPSVCWQLPLKVDWAMRDDGVEVATVRPWARRDWGAEGEQMAWWCTELPEDGGTGEAYVGDQPVVEALAAELEALMGVAVAVELRTRLQR